jgi:hypothetical protein
MEVSGQLHAPAALPPHPLHWGLDRPQSRSGRDSEEKNSQSVPGLEPRAVKLTTHLHLVPRLGMRGVIPPLLRTACNLVKHGHNFTFIYLGEE